MHARIKPQWRALPLRLATAALLFVGVFTGCGDKTKPQRIVVISLDTLRYDALASMPSLQARAAKARVFTRHYAASSCTQPTHASLFTGLAPWQHGVARNGMLLGESATTLAERLKAAGFTTSAVIASFPLARDFGFAQGFDHYRDDFDARMPFEKWDGLEIGDEAFYSLGTRIADEALAALDEAPGDRQFFFFHLFDAHAPYGDAVNEPAWSPSRILDELRKGGDVAGAVASARAAYDRDVAAMDASVERVLVRLDRDAARFETHVVILADHGESFGEHGVLSHGSRITDEQIHVPLILFSPQVAPGSVDVPVGTVDVTATVLSLAGLADVPPGTRDLSAATIPAASVFGMRRTYAKPFADARTDGVLDRVDGHNFYVVEGGKVFTGDGEHVRENDVPGSEIGGEAADKLRRAFAGFAKACDARENEELSDPETKRKLHALGYTE
jgi:arylsulfatase A-like enzyme